MQDMVARLDDPQLDVNADDILVLKNIGPLGAPGMPEAGMLPIPKKLARQGVKDMVRISDGRMSGTASGTIVLHVTPEAALGGPLALVKSGDQIELSVSRRLIKLNVSDEELEQRLAEHTKSGTATAPPTPEAQRGYRKLFLQHVLQADQGCDFDFLRATTFNSKVPSQS